MRTQPAWYQFLTVKTYCPDVCVCIVSATEYSTGIIVGTIYICGSCKITLATVAITACVTFAGTRIPVLSTGSSTQRSCTVTVRIIGNGVDGLTCQTIKNGEILMTTVYTTSACGSPVLSVVGSLDGSVVRSLIHIHSCTVK